MINKIFKMIRNLDKITYRIMKNGLRFCIFLCTISIFVLLFYDLQLQSPLVFNIGLIIFKLSIIFGVEFIICGIVADKIKTDLI